MKSWPILLALLPLLAQADLYRWVDPESGSIKFSNSPPSWMQGVEPSGRRAPAVEVIPFRTASPALAPPSNVAAVPAPAEAKPQTGSAPADSAAPVEVLEAQWRGLLKIFSQLPERTDFERSGTAIRQQLQTYEALNAALDRRDPAGAGRRRAEEATLLERVRKGLEAQFGNRIRPESK